MPQTIFNHFLYEEKPPKPCSKVDQKQLKALSSKCRFMNEVASTAFREFGKLCKEVGKTSPIMFDPFVKDSRCQTQACNTHDLIAWFRTNQAIFLGIEHIAKVSEAETGALLDKIDGLIAMKTPTDKKKREEHRGAMASAVNDLYAAFYLKKWAERCPREFHTANQVAERIRRIVVFFILSCRRGANKETMPSLMHAIEVNIFKNKKLYNKVLKFAQRATKAFDAEQKELNGEQECLKSGITDYMASFITMRNYIVRNHVRVVFFFKKDGELQRFSSYRPSKHSGSVDTLTRRLRRGKSSIDDSRDVDEGADCGVHEGLATVDCCALKDAVRLAPDDPPSPASTDAFLIKKLQDLQQTNTPHNSCKKRAWGISSQHARPMCLRSMTTSWFSASSSIPRAAKFLAQSGRLTSATHQLKIFCCLTPFTTSKKERLFLATTRTRRSTARRGATRASAWSSMFSARPWTSARGHPQSGKE